MTLRLAILCPGQGAQSASMFDLVRAEPGLLASAEGWLRDAGGPVARMPLTDLLAHPAAMFDNRSAQPLVVAASLAAWQALAPRLPRPALVAGYSVGEVSAYAVAGVFPVGESVAIAARRADVMSTVAAAGPGQGMAALSGVRDDTMRAMLTSTGCEVAIDLPASSVVGGSIDGIARLQALADDDGTHCAPLPINVASHTRFLADAVDPLLTLFRAHAAAPSLPLLAGISATNVHDADDATGLLARQAAETIRWTDCLDAIAEARIDVALELGPGTALSRMLRERHPQIACRSVADFRSVKGVVNWVESR